MANEFVLEMNHITKTYGSNTVLKDVTLCIRPGEIHALLGENGAGKSTLMNILFGMPVIHTTGGFQGDILIDGQKMNIISPMDAMEKGIGMVHQEFMLIPGFNVTDNIKLNREITTPWPVSRVLGKDLEFLDRKSMASDARKALDAVGMGIEEYTLVNGLPVGHMQFIEIAREIDKQGMKLLVFDEPTAVLTESEAQQLLNVMKSIASQGIAIIFITHRLDEVMDAADRITILRDGTLISTFSKADASPEKIAALMIGRGEESVISVDKRSSELGAGTAMSIRDLFLESKIPLIGCSDSNTFITRENEYCFRVGLVDSLQGTAVANFLKEKKLFSAAVLRENNDDYALGLTDYFREAYTNLVGGTVVYDGFFEPGTTDFTPQLQEIAAAAPDAIFIPSSSAYAAALITQIRQMGISSQIISGDTWENVQTIRTAGADLCEGVVISSFFRNDDRAASGFVRSFRRYLSASAENLAMNGGTEDVSAFSALGYDAYLSVVGAISSIDGKVTGQTTSVISTSFISKRVSGLSEP